VVGFLHNSLVRYSSSSSLERVSSPLEAYLEEEGVCVFTFLLLSLTMRHVCLERLGKSELLGEDLPLTTMVVKSSLSDSELSSFNSHSCPIWASL
jgi:hypothetical protein